MSETAEARRRVWRVIYEDDPREADYLAAQREVEGIRAALVDVRTRLRAVGAIEARLPFDSMALKAEGAVDCLIVALYGLVRSERSFASRAERVAALWKDIEANPDAYELRTGTDWDWRYAPRPLPEHPGADTTHHDPARENPQDQSVKGEGPDAL